MNKGQVKRELAVLFTCVGRRVSLLESFRDAGDELALKIKVLGTELDDLNPALHVCDEGFIIPKVDSERYIAATLRHFEAWRSGEKNDEETGYNHLEHVLTNIAFLLEFDRLEERVHHED